jgi:putative MATE family efflux protein
MIGLALGSILNMILDPIFIFGFNMGMHGAGLATAFGQFVSFIVLLVLFKKNAQSKFNFKVMSKEFNTYFTIFKTGLPSLIRQGLNSISSGLLNNIAKPFGDECISALSIVSRINMFLLSVGLGMGQGYQPVAGFNYQARKYNRVREGFKFTLITSVVMMGTFCLFAMIFSEQFVSLFIDDSKVIDIAKVALRFTVIALLAMPLSTVGNMLFQSIGKNLVASFLSCLRAGLCYIPLIIDILLNLNKYTLN